MSDSSKLNSNSLDEANKTKSMGQVILAQFLEHKFAVAGFISIVFFALVALFAPVISMISGIDPTDQSLFHRFAKPMTVVEFSENKQDSALLKYSQDNPKKIESLIAYLKETKDIDTSEIDFDVQNFEFLGALNEYVQEDEEFTAELKKLTQPTIVEFFKMKKAFKTTHILGTDELGRDVFMRLVYGTRVSIGVGIGVALVAAIIGLLIGCLAGYYGGWIDSALMRITDALLSLPTLPLMIIFAAIDLKKFPIFESLMGPEGESIFKVMTVLCLFSWMTVARLVRGSILTLKEQDFIHAAKTLGAPDRIIIMKHIVPNVIAPLLVTVTLNIGGSILSEAALGFLGLGIQPPIPSWGNMLSNAHDLIHESPLLAILPGTLILIVVVSFNFFGDGLQDAVDPKAIRR